MDTSTDENKNDEEPLQLPQNISTDLQTSFETFGAERCSSAADNNNSVNRENDGNGTSISSADNILLMTHHQQNAAAEANEPGRRSTRVIKRPKFDDELVESIHKIHQPKVTPKRRQSHDKSVNSSYEEEQSRQTTHKRSSVIDDKHLTASIPSRGEITTPIPQPNSSKASRKRKANDSENTTNGSNKTKKHQVDENEMDLSTNKCATKSAANNCINTLADTAKINWAPEDDIALIAAVTHVSDLHVIYSQMNFSKRYTLDNIEERWYELLYDEKASQNALKRIESIGKDRIQDILAKIPFSMREEQLISQIPSTVPQPVKHYLERILEQNRDQFHHARTVHMLEEHWRELKSLYLLVDQQPLQPQPDDFIEQTYDLQSLVGLDPISDQHPLDVEERQFTRNIAINEREAHEWEGVFTTAVTGIPPTNPVMTSETIGLLCGRCTTFDIRKEKVLIGRSTKRHNVDVNLTLEGPTGMVSRKQAILKVSEGGECLLRNIGKKYLVVNGQVLVTGEAAKLTNNSLIEVAQIRLKFLKNAEYRPPRMIEDGQFINNQR